METPLKITGSVTDSGDAWIMFELPSGKFDAVVKRSGTWFRGSKTPLAEELATDFTIVDDAEAKRLFQEAKKYLGI